MREAREEIDLRHLATTIEPLVSPCSTLYGMSWMKIIGRRGYEERFYFANAELNGRACNGAIYTQKYET